MKLLAVPIFIIFLFTQSFSKWLIVAEFRLNQDYIAKNLCINRNKPKMHCNGKCQLMKKLAAEEEQNTSGNNSQTVKITSGLFMQKAPVIALVALLPDPPSYGRVFLIQNSSSPKRSVFHPPCTA
jgi:hypothetical protein